jgi:hypothetical protein
MLLVMRIVRNTHLLLSTCAHGSQHHRVTPQDRSSLTFTKQKLFLLPLNKGVRSLAGYCREEKSSRAL